MRNFLIALVCASLTACGTGGSGPDYDAATEAIAVEIERDYVDRDQAGELASAMRSLSGADFADGPSYARMITSGLRELSGDDHFHVDFDPDFAVSDDVATEEADPVGAIDRLPGGIVVIEINAFPASQEGLNQITEAVEAADGATAVILDVRGNAGGDPRGVRHLVSPFIAEEGLELFRVDYADGRDPDIYRVETGGLGVTAPDVPLYVLTGPLTFSAGESLAWTLQGHGRAVIVGEATAGAAYLTDTRVIPSGFVLDLPYARPVHPVVPGDWQGEGVTPDIAIPSRAALDAATVDILMARPDLTSPERELLANAHQRLEGLTVQTDNDLSGRYGPFEVAADSYGLRLFNPQINEWRSLSLAGDNAYTVEGLESAVISFVYDGHHVTGMHVDFPDGSEPPLEFPRND